MLIFIFITLQSIAKGYLDTGLSRNQVIRDLIDTMQYAEARELILSSKNLNELDPNLAFWAGDNFLLGKHSFPQHIENAQYWLSISADNNEPNALLLLGELMINGSLVEQDCILGVEYTKASIEHGSVAAKVQLANQYVNGTCVNKDTKVALELLSDPVKLKEPSALGMMGIIHFHGLGVPRDEIRASKYFEEAAALGHCSSIYAVGAMYENGIVYAINLEKALEVFQNAVDEGCDESLVPLAYFYHDGRGVKQDFRRAFLLFQEANKKGDLEARGQMGIMFINGTGIEQNVRRGIQLLQEAAELGDSRSMTVLGTLYFYGEDIERDYNLAAKWYKKAINESDPWAMAHYGFLHEFGLGVELDFEIAEKWYIEATRQGNVLSLHRLATWYINGKYYEINHLSALMILEDANRLDRDIILTDIALLLTCSYDPDIRDIQRAKILLSERRSRVKQDYYKFDWIEAALLADDLKFSEAQNKLENSEKWFNEASQLSIAQQDVKELYNAMRSQYQAKKKCRFYN